ncbi:hypothetical protein JXI42_12845 [bacterium]|nr:hypothetical protein [bacterium]
MKGVGKIVILIVVAVIIVFFIGFIPPKVQVSKIKGELEDLNNQFSETEKELEFEKEIAGITKDLALMYIEVDSKNYGNAEEMAKKIYKKMEEFNSGIENEKVKEKIAQILSRRDRTISLLATGDPEAKKEIKEQLVIFIR